MHPDLFALHWRPKGSGWTMNARMAARMLFFDLVELDANHFLLLSVPLLPALRRPTLAPAPVAASGAVKEGPRNLVSLSDEEDEEQDLGAEEDASTESSVWLGAEEDTATEGSDSYESSESCGDEGGEDEESGRAATGALRGVLRPSEIDEMSEDEKANVLRRVVGIHRQVHFRDADWPEESIMWLCSIDLVQKRRRRLSRLIDILKKQCSPLPSEQEFTTGIAHLSDNVVQAGALYSVVRALSTHKMHYLAKLNKLFRDVAIADAKRFFCVAFPNLQPASGGERVEYLDHAHPAWDLMAEKWGGAHSPRVPEAPLREAQRGGEIDWGFLVDPYARGRVQPRVLVVSVRAYGEDAKMAGQQKRPRRDDAFGERPLDSGRVGWQNAADPQGTR